MKAISVVMGLLAGLFFGLATPLSKIILSQLNSFQLAGLLYIGAALSFLPFILKNRHVEITSLRKTVKKKQTIGIILFGGILGPLFLMMGLQTANAMSVSIWLNLELVATAVLGVLFFKDHLDRFAIIGIILTLAAGIITSVQESNSGIFSGALILLACIAWGFDNHLTAIVDGVSTQTITFIKGVFGGFTNLVIGMFLSDWQIKLDYIPLAIILGVFSYGISIFFYVTSAQNLGATRSQILFSSAPFWGIFTAYLFLGENLSIIVLLAIALLVLGILFTNLASHGHEHFHKGITHIHLHSHDDEHHGHKHIENDEVGLKHSHIHEHTEGKHTHKHYPDIHHRHEH
jgi:drug/metabolite transporter (DMT)-like permease